jgi:hypothetical protein
VNSPRSLVERAGGAIEFGFVWCYAALSILIAIVTFIGAWLYAIDSSGFVLGVGLGWLPAGIVAVLAGFLWPFAAALLLWLFWK